MSIAPIVHSVETKVPPARAFDLFTRRMADWWQRGNTIGKNPHTQIVIEPKVGGRWFEVDAEGNETQWGDVLTWEPPHLLVLAWRINNQWSYDPDLLTEVQLTFKPLDNGGTRLTLEHRDLERFGSDAASHSVSLDSGWPSILAEFSRLANAETSQPD